MSIITSSLKGKLYGGFAVVLLLLCASAAMAVSTMGGLADRTDAVGTVDLPSVETIAEIHALQNDIRGRQMQVVLAHGEERSEARAEAVEEQKQLEKDFVKYRDLVASEEDEALMRESQSTWNAYLAASGAYVGLVAEGKDEAAAEVLTGARAVEAFERSAETIEKWTAANAKSAEHHVEDAAAAAARGKTLILVITLLGIAIGAAVAFFVTRTITGGVAKVLETLSSLRANAIAGLQDGLRAVAKGDLTVEVTADTPLIESKSKDEIGQLSNAIDEISNATAESLAAYDETRTGLTELIGQVNETSQTLSSASQEMASTSEEAGRAGDRRQRAVRAGDRAGGRGGP
jgi:HAMP domain-containing protein